MTSPKVAIGVPVYNGERLLRRALDSLLAQTFYDFELIISDNASTDGTQAICESYAAQDARIRYVRQKTNLGSLRNFHFLTQQAAAPYFMWAAHDDFWEPEFVAENYAVLEARPDVAVSVSRCDFVDELGRKVEWLEDGTFPLMDSPRRNMVRFIGQMGDMSRFYGLQRTEVVRRACPNEEAFHTFDALVVARTLAFGKYFEVDRVLFHRSPDGESSDRDSHLRGRFMLRWFPLLSLTRRFLVDPLVPRSFRVLWALVRLNAAPVWDHFHRARKRIRQRIPLRGALYRLRDRALGRTTSS